MYFHIAAYNKIGYSTKLYFATPTIKLFLRRNFISSLYMCNLFKILSGSSVEMWLFSVGQTHFDMFFHSRKDLHPIEIYINYSSLECDTIEVIVINVWGKYYWLNMTLVINSNTYTCIWYPHLEFKKFPILISFKKMYYRLSLFSVVPLQTIHYKTMIFLRCGKCSYGKSS